MSGRAQASGMISFGLVSIPFKLFPATAAKPVSFSMLHTECGSRLKGHRAFAMCPVENVVVDRSDAIRGFEYARDQYVKLTDEELQALESPRTNDLELLEFVPADSVDALFIAKTYFLGPSKGGERAYRLFAHSLARGNRVAVGRFTARGREKLVLVRPYKGRLLLSECLYADEVRAIDDVVIDAEADFKPVELELAAKLIEERSRDRFEPERYRNTWADKVKDAVEKKVAGTAVVASSTVDRAQVVDLLEWLKQSAAVASKSVTARNDEALPPSGAAVAYPVLRLIQGRAPTDQKETRRKK